MVSIICCGPEILRSTSLYLCSLARKILEKDLALKSAKMGPKTPVIQVWSHVFTLVCFNFSWQHEELLYRVILVSAALLLAVWKRRQQAIGVCGNPRRVRTCAVWLVAGWPPIRLKPPTKCETYNVCSQTLVAEPIVIGCFKLQELLLLRSQVKRISPGLALLFPVIVMIPFNKIGFTVVANCEMFILSNKEKYETELTVNTRYSDPYRYVSHNFYKDDDW